MLQAKLRSDLIEKLRGGRHRSEIQFDWPNGGLSSIEPAGSPSICAEDGKIDLNFEAMLRRRLGGLLQVGYPVKERRCR